MVIIWSRLFLKIEKSPSFQFHEKIGGCALIVIPNSISRWSEEKSSGWTLQFQTKFAVSPVANVTSIVDAALHVIKVGWVPLFIIVRFLLKIKSSKASPLLFLLSATPKGAPRICVAADENLLFLPFTEV